MYKYIHVRIYIYVECLILRSAWVLVFLEEGLTAQVPFLESIARSGGPGRCLSDFNLPYNLARTSRRPLKNKYKCTYTYTLKYEYIYIYTDSSRCIYI